MSKLKGKRKWLIAIAGLVAGLLLADQDPAAARRLLNALLNALLLAP